MEIVEIGHRFESGYGTSKYRCKWKGELQEGDATTLVDTCDGGSSNYGGRIDHITKDENDTYSGVVCVYYD